MKKLNVKRNSLLAFVISTITFALFFFGLFQWTEWLRSKDSTPVQSAESEIDLGSSNITK